MAPAPPSTHIFHRQSAGPIIDNGNPDVYPGDWRKAAQDHPEDLVLESWSQGFVVGALIVMACITVANMRRGVVLHKFILLELLLAMTHGTFCFMTFNGYGWYLSTTAMLLYLSWIIHNVVAWMKVKPFFTSPGGFFKPKIGNWVRRIYLGTLALTIPVIIFQISDNFRFFNNRGGWYESVRAWEPLFRDPWWIFTCIALFHVIRKCYGTGVIGLMKQSPRFGIMMTAIVISIIFTLLDIIASIYTFMGTTEGINPWWKLSLVFKCLTDTIMLDDFKTELKRLGIKRIEKEEARRSSLALVTEYPSGLDGRSSTNHSHSHRNMLSKLKSNPSGSHNFSSDSTVTFTDKDTRDENEDPLSEYAAQREVQAGQKKKTTAPNDPDARQEEVEFATALRLDPRRVSGVESVNRDNQERNNIRSTTKKIGRLPGLREFKFEAINPGKRSSRRSSGSSKGSDSRRQKDDEARVRDKSFSALSFAEEINRNTIMDLESQKLLKEAEQRVAKREKKLEEEREEAIRKRMEELERMEREARGEIESEHEEGKDAKVDSSAGDRNDVDQSQHHKPSHATEKAESGRDKDNKSTHDSNDIDRTPSASASEPPHPQPTNPSINAHTTNTKTNTNTLASPTDKTDTTSLISLISHSSSSSSLSSNATPSGTAQHQGVDSETSEALEDAKREEAHRRRMKRLWVKVGVEGR